MEIYDIGSAPNVLTAISPEGFTYNILFRYFRGMTYATITNDNDELISGPIRCSNRKWLIPYPALNYSGAGNLMFVDEENQYPQFMKFGNGCRLVYFTAEEIANG